MPLAPWAQAAALVVAGCLTAGDAIAHDLRSPLTRLRARLEAAYIDVEAGKGDAEVALAHTLRPSSGWQAMGLAKTGMLAALCGDRERITSCTRVHFNACASRMRASSGSISASFSRPSMFMRCACSG